MPQAYSDTTFEIDHIMPTVHGGLPVASNLALACFLDNNFKGPNLTGIDPLTRKIARLFHPRRNRWHRHFAWDGAVLIGRTPTGRATIAVMRMNLDFRIAHRLALIEEGTFPPQL